jgi:ferrous-iron efflux pump FieF
MQENSHFNETARLLRIATYASVLTASVLIGGKLVAWLMTSSVSVLASLVDSLMDVAASLINLFAVRYSLMPADKEHRFGHGKAESLAGLAQATFIAGSAAFLILHAIDRLMYPHPLEDIAVGIGVMIFAVISTLVLLLVQRHVIKKTGSTAIRADSLHYVTDLFTNLSIIAALALAYFGWSGLDPIFAIGIALYILYSAWEIGHEAFQLLLDRELPDDIRNQIKQIAISHAGVRGIHDMRTRKSGQTEFIQLHLELDDHLPLVQSHKIADEVEMAIQQAFPMADIIIHQDPVSANQSETTASSV